jgi:outer membrane protein assembly factor BamB
VLVADRPVAGRVIVPAVLALLAALALLAGCAGAPIESAPPPAYDPPTGFAAPTGSLFAGSGSRVFGRDPDDLPAALVGTAVWATDGGRLLRVDSSGTEIPGPAAPPGRHVAGRPVATPDGTVLVGAASVVPGSGTTPPGLSVELLAYDAATGALRWSAPTVLPWADRPPAVTLRVAGVAAGVAVLTAGTDTRRTALGVDLTTRGVLWTADGVAVDALLADGPAAGTALGVATTPGESRAYASSTVVGLDVVTGLRRFGGGEVLRAPEITSAGPGLAVVSGRTAATTLAAPAATLRFVDARGATVRTVDVGRSYTPPRCVWDEAATTVCGGDTRVFAVDATTAAPLWELPDPVANRVAPQLTTAWHGAVYGTTVNGPVVLDARTGADRDTRPGAAPVLVNAYLGVGAETTGVAGFGGGAVITPAVR